MPNPRHVIIRASAPNKKKLSHCPDRSAVSSIHSTSSEELTVSGTDDDGGGGDDDDDTDDDDELARRRPLADAGPRLVMTSRHAIATVTCESSGQHTCGYSSKLQLLSKTPPPPSI